MDIEERHQLRDFVNGLLVGHGVKEEARVTEKQMRFDSAISHAIEIIEVYLPHAASALGGAMLKTIGNVVVDHVKGKMRVKAGPKRTVMIYGPDDKPMLQVDVDDNVPKR